jgi:hypothetical protein
MANTTRGPDTADIFERFRALNTWERRRRMKINRKALADFRRNHHIRALLVGLGLSKPTIAELYTEDEWF